MYCDQRSQYIRLSSKENSFCGNTVFVFHRSISLKAKRHLNQNQRLYFEHILESCIFISNISLKNHVKLYVQLNTSCFLSFLKTQNFLGTILCSTSIHIKKEMLCDQRIFKMVSSNFLKVKFIYSKKATQFWQISTLILSYVVPVKSKVEI